MARSDIVLLSLVLSLVILAWFMSQTSMGQEVRNCEPHKICVLPGDYLKFSESTFGKNMTNTYSFGNFIGPDMISLNLTSDTYNGTTTIDPILNLRNNTLIYENGKHQSFLMMMPLPLGPKWIGQPQFSDEVINFNGVNRTTIGHHVHTTTTLSDVNLDKETGIMLNFDAF